MPFTDHLEAQIMNKLFKGIDFVQPTEWWVGLFVAQPDEIEPNFEVSGNNYARVKCNFDVRTGQTAAWNTELVQYVVATGEWGNITHIGLFDAQTGGNFLAYQALQTPKYVSTGDEVRFGVDQLRVTLE
jgi:hypothetical protein